MRTSKAFKSSSFIKTGRGIFSRSFDGHRVDVRLAQNTHAKSPVLIVHDGMNVFFSRYASTGDTWQIIEGLESGKIIGDPVVIAVWGEGGTKKYNSRRINEFLCDDIFALRPELWETLNPLLTPESREHRGNYFLSLVADQILPITLSEFGIEHDASRTAIAGCSVAGVAAIYSVAKRPDAFATALGFSSHWEFGGKALIDELVKMLSQTNGLKIWSDTGSEELDAASLPLHNYFEDNLTQSGFDEHNDFETPIFWGTGHHETFWSRRVEYPINFWLKSLDASKK